jgi:ligand-binding SRPBCC domain-containing protein
MPVPAKTASFEITTRLAAPADQVWSAALTEEGINDELRPWLRMTMPRAVEPGMTIEDVPLGTPIGRSWILLGRFLPVEYDDLCLVGRGPGMRFVERSRMASARSWRHEREVVALGDDTCEITDRLELEPRAVLQAVGGARVAERIVRFLFTHRHERLRERWGDA